MVHVLDSYVLSRAFYAFQRGSCDEELDIWSRDEAERKSLYSELYSCIYFTIVTMIYLGQRDICPRSYVGKAVSLYSTVLGKGRKADGELTLYIEDNISRACN